MDEQGSIHAARKKGGLVTMPFIFANKVCEKLAVVGFHANMISDLTTQLHMPLTKAANTLTISAVLPQLRPPPCTHDQVCEEADGGQLAILYVSLLLEALASGGIRSCVMAFGVDQFDENDEKQTTKTWNYFNWYYFVMGVSILVSVTVLVYIQDNIGWGWGLGIPTIAVFLSVIAFVIGHSLYRNLAPAGSPFTRLIQVSVAAYKKRKLSMVSDPRMLYQNDELDRSISIGGKLLHTKHLNFVDNGLSEANPEVRAIIDMEKQ
ncbi:hypothetical protein PS1_008675 [Malus domestica]